MSLSAHLVSLGRGRPEIRTRIDPADVPVNVTIVRSLHQTEPSSRGQDSMHVILKEGKDL